MQSDQPTLRLDQLLVRRRLVSSRTRAQQTIAEGHVRVNGDIEKRPGRRVSLNCNIALVQPVMPYVSRGALKLKHALQQFHIDVKERIVLDIGASTGGFTQLVLENGARLVYAVDVGENQLHASLRTDPRVISMEKTNVRSLQPDVFSEQPEIVVIDVSFISLTLVLPVVKQLTAPGGNIVALVKPQFEVGKHRLGKGGIVRNENQRQAALKRVIQTASTMAFRVMGTCQSPIQGKSGNTEYFVYLRQPP